MAEIDDAMSSGAEPDGQVIDGGHEMTWAANAQVVDEPEDAGERDPETKPAKPARSRKRSGRTGGATEPLDAGMRDPGSEERDSAEEEPDPGARTPEPELEPDGWPVTGDEEEEEASTGEEENNPADAGEDPGEETNGRTPADTETEFDEAAVWYQRWEQAEDERRRLLSALQQQGGAPGAAPGAAGPSGLPGGAAAAAGPSGVPAGMTPTMTPVPTLETLAEQFGSVPDDPAVIAMHRSLEHNARLERQLHEFQSQIAPVLQERQQAELEQRIQAEYMQNFVYNPTRVPPEHRDWYLSHYANIRRYFGSRARSFEDAANLYLIDLNRQAAPQQAYAAGVADGHTAVTHRQQRGRMASVTAGSRPHTRQLDMPTPQTIEEAYRQAQAMESRRRK